MARPLQDGKIICPFHDWRWDLAGRNEFVLERHGFGGNLKTVTWRCAEVLTKCLPVCLHQLRRQTAFDEFIAPVRDLLEGMAIEHMRHYWWKKSRRRQLEGRPGGVSEAYRTGYPPSLRSMPPR